MNRNLFSSLNSYFSASDHKFSIDFNKIKCAVYDIDRFNEAFKTDDNFKVLKFNVRSLSKKFNELQLFLDSLKCDFDVLVLTET